MNVIAPPSADRLSATSDLELKLVVTRLVGTGSVLTTVPVGVSWSRKIGEVMPKLPSRRLLLKTLLVLVREAYAPLSVAFPPDDAHAADAGQTGGSTWPTARLAAVALYTLLLTTMLPGVNAVCAEALAARLAAAIIEILKLEVFIS